ncbi:MAG: DUF932 domain-containing protein [Dehalococcoidia bacterium]|jgi:hypothetical protein
MAAGITEIDRGVVWGTTWHNLPQYKTKKVPVTLEEARQVLDFPIEKRQLGFSILGGNNIKVNAYALVRSGTDHVLVDSVGERFIACNNVDMLNHIAKTVLKEFPQLKIESVGTLWAGATSFLNLKVDAFQVKGDKSETINRIMWYNPLGLGSYKTCAHNVRVVCDNTLRAAHVEGKANGTLRGIAHTATGAAKVQKELDNLARHFLELESLTQQMQQLAKKPMTSAMIESFLSQLVPIGPELEKSAVTQRQHKRETFMHQFESDQALAAPVNRSAYAMLNAVTYVLDHQDAKRGQDLGGITWDGLVGTRAGIKDQTLALLNASCN